MKILIIFFASIFYSHQVSAQQFGACLKTPVIHDFNTTKYLGKWYEIKRFNYIFEQQNLQCVIANYAYLNQTAVSVNNYGFNLRTNKTDGRIGYAYVPNVAEPNKLSVVLPVEVFNVTILQGHGPYDVLETDYNTYALVYSCTQVVVDLVKLEVVWILARTPQLDEKLVHQLEQRLQSYKIDTKKLVTTDQNCGF